MTMKVKMKMNLACFIGKRVVFTKNIISCVDQDRFLKFGQTHVAMKKDMNI